MSKRAQFSLFRLDFFNLNFELVCDFEPSDLECTSNAIRPTEVFDAIIKRENDLVHQAAADGRIEVIVPFTSNDIYITTVDWVKQQWTEMVQRNDPNASLYEDAKVFLTYNTVLAAYGVDADETDTYVLVVEYIEQTR